MSTLTTTDQLLSCVASRSQQFEYLKVSSALVTGTADLTSTWLSTGIPGPGVAPGSAAVPTSATAGALFKFVDPSGGEYAYLYSIEAQLEPALGIPYYYDRLIHHGGLSGADTALKTVNTPAINRGDTSGVGTIGFVECYSALGGIGQTLTISYTNTAGTSARSTTVAMPATMRAGRVIQIPLVSGDTGIKSIETVQLGGSMTGSGSYGVTIARRITMCDILINQNASQCTSKVRTGLELGFPIISSSACIWMVCRSTSSSTLGKVSGSMTIITTG